jgi:hypothetical protein
MDMYTSITLGLYLLDMHNRNIREDADPVERATPSAGHRPVAGLVGALAAIGVVVIALNLAA